MLKKFHSPRAQTIQSPLDEQFDGILLTGVQQATNAMVKNLLANFLLIRKIGKQDKQLGQPSFVPMGHWEAERTEENMNYKMVIKN